MRKAIAAQMVALTNQFTQTDVIMDGGDAFTAEERINSMLKSIDLASELATTCLAFAGSMVVSLAKGKDGIQPCRELFEAVTEDARAMMMRHLIGFLISEVQHGVKLKTDEKSAEAS